MTSASTVAVIPTRALSTQDCGCDDGTCDPPKALERNAFFPRKLMEVKNWQAEQSYHRLSRELVTRLATGSGVLCGLEVSLSTVGTVVISAGVATDGRGRTIVVPYDFEIDVGKATGYADGSASTDIPDGPATISVCYRECGVDPVAVSSSGCDDDPTCIPSMIREAFCITVTPGTIDRTGLPEEVCDAVHTGRGPDIPVGETEDRRVLLDRLDPRNCACLDECVPLAVATVTTGVATVVDTTVRTVIRSNRELLDLILCLSEHLDDCCGTTTTAPPRITAMWPESSDTLPEFLGNGLLEIAFDRDMSEQGLQAPNDWLGVWVLGSDYAQRLPLERSSGPLKHVTAPGGGDAAAFRAKISDNHPDSAVIVIMVRSSAASLIRADEIDHLALDPDWVATALDQSQRDALWALAPDASDPSLGALVGSATVVASPPFPTGDGTAGGDLHYVLTNPQNTQIPPALMTIWPDSGIDYAEDDQKSNAVWKDFIGRPRISITVSAELKPDDVANRREWLRIWHWLRDGDNLYAFGEIELGESEPVELVNGIARYTFPFGDWTFAGDPDWFLIQLRPDTMPVGGADAILLDAHFKGTNASSQNLIGLWKGDGAPANKGFPAFTSYPSAEQKLSDGTPGGFAHWGLTVHQPRLN